MSFFTDVVEWHQKVGHPVSKEQSIVPGEAIDLGWELIVEEFKELVRGMTKQDIEEVADGLGDMIWVLCGFGARAGINLDAVWSEIRAANFRKIGGPVREDGKLLKPPGWEPPNIQRALRVSVWGEVEHETKKCSVCGETQYRTYSGWVCSKGHGGAPSCE